MIENALDYIYEFKYLVGAMALLGKSTLFLLWKQRRLNKRIQNLEKWSQELYGYLNDHISRRND